ncbi:MAG: hypothetical protein ACI4QT_00170, partial [Kiritimatiellia bacterium]
KSVVFFRPRWLTAFVFLSLQRNGLCVSLCSFSRVLALWLGFARHDGAMGTSRPTATGMRGARLGFCLENRDKNDCKILKIRILSTNVDGGGKVYSSKQMTPKKKIFEGRPPPKKKNNNFLAPYFGLVQRV